LTLYGIIEEEQREEFLALARQANAPGWWHQYGDILSSWFEVYLGLEQAASRIRTYEAQFIPGLLQTEEYARAVIRLSHTHGPIPDTERRVALRMARQELLTPSGPNATTLWAVLDEAALRRPLGSREVMRTQLERLVELAEYPNITLQILPLRIGSHAAAGGTFTVLRFPEPDLPDIVYIEQLTSALYLDKRQDIDKYLAVLENLCVQAMSPTETCEFIKKILTEG
ncbi:MAG: DUF5753 domain-containing protein, partial [Pseudonocardiaceae bacterium]